MTGKAARAMVRRLALTDMATRMGFRLAAWLAAALAVWGSSLLLSIALLDSRLRPSALAFHAAIMAAAGSLPAFLAYPFRAAWATDAIRRSDGEAAIESWLGYPGGPAERMLESRAHEALSIAALNGPRRPRAAKGARAAVAGLYVFAVASFAAAQIASIYSGCGVSLSYPVKRLPEIVVERTGSYDEAPVTLVPGIADIERMERDAERDAPGARRYAGPGAREKNALADPDFVSAAGSEDRAAEGEEPDGEPGTERVADGLDRGSVRGAGGRGSGDRGPTGDEGGASSGEARAPGWEGSGRAIGASPLVDYRARFERQLTEASGRETTLGDAPSAGMVAGAIAEFFASFDARVSVGSRPNPGIARAEASWLRAFGMEAAE